MKMEGDSAQLDQPERVPASEAEIALSFAPLVKTAAPAVVNIYAQRVVADSASPLANDPFFSQWSSGWEANAASMIWLGIAILR